jgi:kynurenine formamidase
METWYPSKWGGDDELGALNEISLSKVCEAARLVKSGKIYNLSQTLESGIPQHWFHGEFFYSTFRRHSDSIKLFAAKNEVGAMNMRLEMADHTGTHIDGLNHTSIKGRVYNGRLGDEITSSHGTSKLGIENTPPIFTRGLLSDVASLKGQERLQAGYVISAEEIADCLKGTNVELRRGDALLIRTGWSQLWMSDNSKYLSSCPGIGKDAGKWLAERGVSLIGADTGNVEVDPNEDAKESDVVHQFLITQNGIRLIENLNLESLSYDRVSEFLFICLPLRIKGGTGSPISPIAVT